MHAVRRKKDHVDTKFLDTRWIPAYSSAVIRFALVEHASLYFARYR